MVASNLQVSVMEALLVTSRIESLICLGFGIGASLLVVHRTFGKSAKEAGGRVAKVFVELQRKSFHMIGGCIICSAYHWGIKYGFLTSAYQSCLGAGAQPAGASGGAMDGGIFMLAACLVSWIVEASRIMVPAVQKWYLDSFKGLIRQKEMTKAAGIAYFLPGSLAAMLAAPSDVALLGILFLSVGDAAASIGTAAGCIPVGASSRKVEGSIGCFAVCTGLGIAAGLPSDVALITSTLVTIGEVLAEVIGLDDNFVIPLLGVLGVRLALTAQIWQLFAVMGAALGVGVLLGVAVGSTTVADGKGSAEGTQKAK